MTEPVRPGAPGVTPGRGRPLLPVLPPATGPLDPVAIATWHLALSDAVGAELPHELLALWLFPDAGGVVLLGPAALAEDAVEVARPDPELSQEQLLGLEERFRRAGYASVIAAPIRDRERDLGLMLLAALAAGQYGPIQAVRLFDLLRHLAEPFRQLATRAPASAEGLRIDAGADLESVLRAIARVGAGAGTAGEFLTRLSGALHGALPHDEIAILVPLPGSGQWDWFGLGAPPRRWTSESGRDSRIPGLAALRERLRQHPVFVVRDLDQERDGLLWPYPPHRRDRPKIRSLLAVALPFAGTTVGYLLLGSAARDLYRPGDDDRLAACAESAGPIVAALLAAEDAETLRRTVAALEGPGGALARVVRRLATVPHFGEATQEVGRILSEVTGATRCGFILRLSPSEGVRLEPGEVRPLLDLPLVPLDSARFGPVVRGEAAVLMLPEGEEETLVVPLRLAARPFGAMLLTGPAGGRLAAVTLAAQQLADAIAPHLEMLRREASEVRMNP